MMDTSALATILAAVTGLLVAVTALLAELRQWRRKRAARILSNVTHTPTRV